MNNNKSKIILEQSYADLLPEIIDDIISHDEQPKALELYKILEKVVNENINELKLQSKLLEFYKNIILKLKFVCLPVLDDKEIFSLIKNNFCFQLTIKDYDFFSKLKAKLLNIILIEDRNKFKEDLKQAILENNERITPNYEIKVIKDWLKNYLSKVGLDIKDNLAQAQYFIALKNNKGINSKELESLIALFKFYDILNTPSDSPEGFEEEYPIMVNGKLNIFRKGILEPVNDDKKIDEAMELAGETGTKEIKTSSKSQSIITQSIATKSVPTQSEIKPLSPLEELEQTLKNYSESSFEHKALRQEISRLKKSELTKAQHDVKK